MSPNEQDGIYEQPTPEQAASAAMREEVERQRRSEEIADFEWLMSGPRGRRIAWRLLGRCQLFRTSYHPNFGEMAKTEGMKQLGYWLIEQIRRHCPDHELKMIEENTNGRAGTGIRNSN